MNNLLLYFQNIIQKFSFSPIAAFSFAIIFLTLTAQTFAVGGAVDPTFTAGITNFSAQTIETVAVQTDGRILIGGEFDVVGGVRRNRIARLNADGTVDASFNSPSGANSTVFAIVVQPDGKILVGGSFSSFNGANNKFITRLNADGTNDPTFVQTALNSTVLAITLQTDGKIVIGGSFNLSNAPQIARLNIDGSFDNEFSANLGTGANNSVYGLALDANGKILLGGFFTIFNGVASNRLARLNPNGTLDTGFAAANGTIRGVTEIAVQRNGKILVGGSFANFYGAGKSYLARVNSDGSLDASFNIGTGPNATVNDIAIQTDGKILVGGIFNIFNGQTSSAVVRIAEDGSLDTMFVPPNLSGTVKAVKLQLTGEIIAAGNFSAAGSVPRTSIAQFDQLGNLDANFATVIGSAGIIYAIKTQADGKIIVGGLFVGANDKFRSCIARFNADGTLDETFDPGAGANSIVYAVAVQADGKIIVGGIFSSYNGVNRSRLARLNADGSLDTTFNASLNGSPDEIIVQPDGKILIAGGFTAANGDLTRKHIVRLNADGTIDSSFAANSYSSNINAADLQTNGKIVIGGSFTSIGGAAYVRLARLNADGSVDASFNPGTGANGVPQVIKISAGGKITVGGNFTQIGGENRNYFARLNADGSLDSTFNTGMGATSTVLTIAEQADGKIIVGGEFTQFNSVSRARIARVNADGSLDASFNPGTGANGTVNAAEIAADGRIIIGGAFSAVNNISRIALASLLAGGTSVWTGAANSNYENPANWMDNLVPANADGAEIPANAANQPVLSGAASLTSLQIAQNASLTINSGASLNLQGLVNDGVVQGAGILNLNGATFSNNGTISVSNVNFSGGGGIKSLGGAGAFIDNAVNINDGVRLRLDNNHTFNQINIASGASFDITSRTVRLKASGAALNGSLDTNFSTVIYQGTQSQTINFPQLFNLTVDNPAGVSMGRNLIIAGTLDLKNGNLTTGTNLLLFPTQANFTRTNGFVVGKIQKSFNAGQSFTFPVGNSNGYAPVGVSNIQTAGTFTARANDGFLSGTNENQSLQTNWTLNDGGIGRADLVLQYPQQSVPAGANEANFKFVRRSASVNTEFAPSSFDVNSNIFTLSNVSEFSDWTLGNNLAPTAASVTIGGRALDGMRGIGNVWITLTNGAGVSRTVQTSSFGYYRFSDVPAGETYVITAKSKRYAFTNPTRVLTVTEELTNIDFVAGQNGRGGKIVSVRTDKSKGGTK